MRKDDEVNTNDDARQRLEVESKNPQIRVGTDHCVQQGTELDCKLDEPVSTSLLVALPYVVSIVNDRNACVGSDRKVTWKIGSTAGTLQAGQTASHPMAAEQETLELFYDNCLPDDGKPPGGPDPGTTPRVTINLIKSRNE